MRPTVARHPQPVILFGVVAVSDKRLGFPRGLCTSFGDRLERSRNNGAVFATRFPVSNDNKRHYLEDYLPKPGFGNCETAG
jgi:hypothetical protein